MRKKLIRFLAVSVFFSALYSSVAVAEDGLSVDNINKKEEIYEKMLNSIDNYSSIQGVFQMKGIAFGVTEDTTVVYKADIENNVSQENANSVSKEFETIAVGEEVSDYDHKAQTYMTRYRALVEDPVKDIPIEERRSEFEGEPVWEFRMNTTSLGYAQASIFPQTIAFAFLHDFQQWEIIDEEEYSKRPVVVIEGKVQGYIDDNRLLIYKLWVDRETGCLLKYEGKNEDGEQVEYLNTQEILYDEPVVQTYSFRQYDDYTNILEVQDRLFGF